MHSLDEAMIHEYSGQSGYGSLPYFVGKQYGTGWLRNIARFAFPFLRQALGVVGTVAGNTVQDMIENKNKSLGQSIKENTLSEAKKILKRKASSRGTRGSGINRSRRKVKRNIII